MGQKKLKIAITGNIGSGKSEFSKVIEINGYTVIKADDVSKDILANDSIVKEKIINTFGGESFIGNEINRKYLAEKVFSNPENVIVINSIIHPLVIKKVEQMMNEGLKGKNKIFVEAALIYEADMEDMFDYVVLLTAKKEIRYERKSTELNLCDFEKRDSSQIPEEEKKKRADFIFENNGNLNDLKNKAGLLLTILS